ncbi:MAG: type II toxin-antitoxin system mRNA interferase toxin, RelE/StbE family [Candidatus Gribaldobacteria bacterium]|nr:type II toxin-antitoxin system mRNA interferase toxin, RelE/StbE family [Candidatus Gribaldobacteria bacterium]
MKVFFHKNFDKQFSKLRANEKKKVQERLQLFLENPFNPILENHPLKGKYTDYRSINITGDLRAIYKFLSDNEAIFVAVDTHSNLYS